MASVEVPYDMKDDKRTGCQGAEPLEIFSTTPFTCQGNALLDIRICSFLHRKEQLHLLFQCYLSNVSIVLQIQGRFKRLSNTNVFSLGGGGRLLTSRATPLDVGSLEIDNVQDKIGCFDWQRAH